MCNGVYVEDYLRKEGIEYDSLEIVVNRKYGRDPRRVTEFVIQIYLQGDLSEEERKGALEAAHRCYIGNTFEGTPQTNIRLTG